MVSGTMKYFPPDVFRNKVINRQGKLGDDACKIMHSAINAVDPYTCVQNFVHVTDKFIRIGSKKIHINDFDRIFLLGLGKASVLMAKAVIDIFGEKIAYAAVITKNNKYLSSNGYGEILEVYTGGHPVPSKSSVNATKLILSNLPDLTSRDLVFVLISGGGSALFTKPVEGISLDDLQSMTEILLKCGADIGEINTLRKHLDGVKGGRLALDLQPAQIYSLILSDVIGDPLDMIASGPTVPDPTSFQDAIKIVEKYDLKKDLPKSILQTLERGISGDYSETLKPNMMDELNVTNQIIGSNFQSAAAALKAAKELGYNSLILSTHLTGDTEVVAEFLAGIIDSEVVYDVPINKPACVLFGGETTVRVTGDGLGGRNQDLALRMVEKLDGKQNLLFISLATDGEDGPTDAAGGAVDGLVFDEGAFQHHLNISSFIKNNNSYEYLENVGGLLKIGSTGTNVNDLILMLFTA